jgi:DNA-binding NarL/FixJ family response regulator/CRISPR/Cas system CMR-associated protein Cmr5 small subunit
MSNDIQGKAIRLILIDHDPIFRLGLRTCLAQETDLQVLVDVSTVAEALHYLEESFTAGSAAASIDLGILAVGGADAPEPKMAAIALIQTLQNQYPQLPLLLMDSRLNDEEIHRARQLGVKGYFPKGTDPTVLINAIRQITAGVSDWVGGDIAISAKHPGIPAKQRRLSVSGTPTKTQAKTPAKTQAKTPAAIPVNPRRLWMHDIRVSANRLMDAQIQELDVQLKNVGLSQFDRFFLLGRRRELRVARWMVNQILPAISESETQLTFPNQQSGVSATQISSVGAKNSTDLSTAGSGDLQRFRVGNAPGSSSQIYPLDFPTLKSQLFDRILTKLQSRLENLTDIPLEIDLLKLEKKQQLFYLILRQFEEILGTLNYSQIQPDILREKQEILVTDLWQAVLGEFFGKYASLPIGDRAIDMVPLMEQDTETVKSSILKRIPQVSELFAYVLFQTSFTIENVEYLADTPEALDHAEFLLENFMIQVANATIYPLLNRFADVETIKQDFYDRRWMTTREIERFRNNLSWRYRWQKYWQEPKSIFESQYVLLVFDERGIRKVSSYAPRRQELAQLNGLQQTVTLWLETRDAIAPRLESMMVFLGSGGRYLLMQLGRGIGLIAQGIIQGIGNSLQDLKVKKNRQP